MGVIMWDAPKKVRTPQQQEEHYSWEEGPKGGYDPNMSPADAARWRGKITGQKRGSLQAEIHRKVGITLVNLIVSLQGGYTYKHYAPGERGNYNTNGVNVHISANGAIMMTFAEMAEIHDVVAEAQLALMEAEAKAKNSVA